MTFEGRSTQYWNVPVYLVGALLPQRFAYKPTTSPEGPAVNPGIMGSSSRCHLLSIQLRCRWLSARSRPRGVIFLPPEPRNTFFSIPTSDGPFLVHPSLGKTWKERGFGYKPSAANLYWLDLNTPAVLLHITCKLSMSILVYTCRPPQLHPPRDTQSDSIL